MPPVKKNDIRQPHAPSYLVVNSATTIGPTIPATAPIVLPILFNAEE